MKKDIEETYNLEDLIAVLQFELSENMNSRKQKELNYYLFLKESLGRFEYEEEDEDDSEYIDYEN